jgi:hypothetical protein
LHTAGPEVSIGLEKAAVVVTALSSPPATPVMGEEKPR